MGEHVDGWGGSRSRQSVRCKEKSDDTRERGRKRGEEEEDC